MLCFGHGCFDVRFEDEALLSDQTAASHAFQDEQLVEIGIRGSRLLYVDWINAGE